MRYWLKLNDGTTIFKNLTVTDEKMLDSVLVESVLSASRKQRIGKISSAGAQILATSSDPDCIKSSQKFKNTARTILGSIKYIQEIMAAQRDSNNRNTARLIHNLTTLNAHSIQEVYSLIPQEEISGRINDHLKYVVNKINADPIEASRVILRIAKNNAAMKTEFSVFKKLFIAEPHLRPTHHKMHKVLMNIFYLFYPDFTDKNVSVSIEPSEAMAFFDYESIHVALYHLIDNASKYTLPNSKLTIQILQDRKYTSLIFKMRSTKIAPEESGRIYDEGFSGSTPKIIGKSGDGIGMSLVKRIMESNHGLVSHRSLPNTREISFGIDYDINEFTLQLPNSKN